MSGYSPVRLSCAGETRQGCRAFRPAAVTAGQPVEGASKRRGRIALVELRAKRFALEEDDALAGAQVIAEDDFALVSLPVEELHGAARDLAGSLVERAESFLQVTQYPVVGLFAAVSHHDSREVPIDRAELHGIDRRRPQCPAGGVQFIGLYPARVFDLDEPVGFRERRTPGNAFEPVRVVLHGDGQRQSDRQEQRGDERGEGCGPPLRSDAEVLSHVIPPYPTSGLEISARGCDFR
ncbi:hypothetical protein NSND_61321 [Nitrospira sp. ND1]|nr:hypothetical protein NSND_61321 [Nitrospira sp. ND1]